MSIPNPSVLVKRQTEAVGNQFEGKKQEIMGQIAKQVEKQIDGIKANEEKQSGIIDGKIAELQTVLNQMPDEDPRKKEVAKQLGMLKEQKKQLKAQVRLAIASVKANAAREKENIKSRLEREKSKAIRSAVEAALGQFSALMQKKRMEKEGAVNDELRAGNRG